MSAANFKREQRQKLEQGLHRLGLQVTPEQVEALEKFLLLLELENQKLNLTAIDPENSVELHILDSVSLLSSINIPLNSSILDLGSGAGLPGIPLKIIRPDLKITLLDARKKKVNFLESVCRELKLQHAECLHARAEYVAHEPAYREQFDFVVARAVAALPVLSELILPFTKINGLAIAMKSKRADEESKLATNIISELGGDQVEIISGLSTNQDLTRNLILMRKLTGTPAKFPRTPKKIKENKAKT